MDSLSQIALGAAVSIAVFRRRQPLWQSAALGAVLGTLPDLDVLIQHGDPISDMTLHRTESHSLFYLTLLSPLLAWFWLKILNWINARSGAGLCSGWLAMWTQTVKPRWICAGVFAITKALYAAPCCRCWPGSRKD